MESSHLQRAVQLLKIELPRLGLSGARINEINDVGTTPVLLAVLIPSASLLRELLQAGGDPFILNDLGVNAVGQCFAIFPEDKHRLEKQHCADVLRSHLGAAAIRDYEQAGALANLLNNVLLPAHNEQFLASDKVNQGDLMLERLAQARNSPRVLITPAAQKGKTERAQQERQDVRSLLRFFGRKEDLLTRFDASDGNWLASLREELAAMLPPAFATVYCNSKPTKEEFTLMANHNSDAAKSVKKKFHRQADGSFSESDHEAINSMLLAPFRERGFIAKGGLDSLLDELVVDPIQHCVGFGVPSDAAVTAIGRRGPIVEVGAGTGYWAALLRHHGVDVVAFDSEPPTATHNNGFFDSTFTEVRKADCTTVFDGEGGADLSKRALLIVWPNNPDQIDNPHLASTEVTPPTWDAKCLTSYFNAGGTTVIYVGEREENIKLLDGARPDCGVSSSRRFQQMLSEKFFLSEVVESPGFGCCCDDLTIWTKV